MADVLMTQIGFTADRHKAILSIEVVADPSGIRQYTILDRTMRRISGIRDSRATVNLPNCPLRDMQEWEIALEFFPISVQVFECDRTEPEVSSSFSLPGANDFPPPPNCPDDSTQHPPPSRECIQANENLNIAREVADGLCDNLTRLTTAQDNLRQEYNGHIRRWLTLTAVAVAATVFPLIGLVGAIVISGVAVASLVMALRASRQASSLNDAVADTQHRWELARLRYTELTVHVIRACCPWDRPANVDQQLQCHHPPPWSGSLATGKIGRPGGP
jgi:hypothetical protein